MTKAEDYFSISTLQIWRDGKFVERIISNSQLSNLELKCLHEIWQFNSKKGQMKFLSEIRAMAGYGDEDCSLYNWKNERRDLASQGFYFGLGTYYELNETTGQNEPVGILIREDLSPDYQKDTERQHYFELFPYRLITLTKAKPDQVENFLLFQLKNSFNDNKDSFKSFLINISASKSEILAQFKGIIEDFINRNLSTNKESKSKGIRDNINEFDSLFTNEGLKAREYIINKYTNAKPKTIALMLLALKELDLIQPNTLSNESETHRILESTLGKIGTRQALNSRLKQDDPYQKNAIVKVIADIKRAIKDIKQ